MEKEQLQNKSDGESACKKKNGKTYSEKWWRKNIKKT